jgi:hypothetical protein
VIGVFVRARLVRRGLLSVALCAAAAVSLARAPNYPAAAQALNEAIAAAETDAAGQGLLVVYYDEDDEGVSRSIGREWVTVDGERVGRFERQLRYVILRVRAGVHSIGIDSGRSPVVRQVLTVAEGSRNYLRYVRSLQPTATKLFFDVQVANLTTFEPVEEDAARERIATIDAIVAANWRR